MRTQCYVHMSACLVDCLHRHGRIRWTHPCLYVCKNIYTRLPPTSYKYRSMKKTVCMYPCLFVHIYVYQLDSTCACVCMAGNWDPISLCGMGRCGGIDFTVLHCLIHVSNAALYRLDFVWCVVMLCNALCCAVMCCDIVPLRRASMLCNILEHSLGWYRVV